MLKRSITKAAISSRRRIFLDSDTITTVFIERSLKFNAFLFSENATKFCRSDGTWEKSYYDLCINITELAAPPVEYNTLIYGIGYSISIVALSLAVIIFLHFK